jgi:enoyl-CoA hydratase/carnithine racemase
MRDEFYEVLGAVRDDPDVKVVILKGAGEKAFCAGADLIEFLTAPPPVMARWARFARDVWGGSSASINRLSLPCTVTCWDPG